MRRDACCCGIRGSAQQPNRPPPPDCLTVCSYIVIGTLCGGRQIACREYDHVKNQMRPRWPTQFHFPSGSTSNRPPPARTDFGRFRTNRAGFWLILRASAKCGVTELSQNCWTRKFRSDVWAFVVRKSGQGRLTDRGNPRRPVFAASWPTPTPLRAVKFGDAPLY